MLGTTVRGVLIAITMVIIVFDIMLAVDPVPGNTISAVIFSTAHEYFTLSVVSGVLMGHFFWPRERPLGGLAVFFSLAGLLALSLGIDLLWSSFQPGVTIPFLVGFVCGHLMWGQKARRTSGLYFDR